MNVKLVIFFISIFSSLSCYSQKFDKNIVLINVEDLNRSDMARLITLLNDRYDPKVIAVNLLFEREGDIEDLKLASALSRTKKLVMAVELSDLMILVGGNPMFYPSQSTVGFYNLIHDDGLFNITRYFNVMPDSKFGKIPTFHFAVQTAMEFDSLRAKHFVGRQSNVVEIDFNKRRRCYKVISSEEILNAVLKTDISGKIVLLGSLNSESKYFTPLLEKKTNSRIKMDELEIFANIISQILE